jgi:hypothetical protein
VQQVLQAKVTLVAMVMQQELRTVAVAVVEQVQQEQAQEVQLFQ